MLKIVVSLMVLFLSFVHAQNEDAAAYAYLKSYSQQLGFARYTFGALYGGIGAYAYFAAPSNSVNQVIGGSFAGLGVLLLVLPTQYEMTLSAIDEGRITPMEGLRTLAEAEGFSRILSSVLFAAYGMWYGQAYSEVMPQGSAWAIGGTLAGLSLLQLFNRTLTERYYENVSNAAQPHFSIAPTLQSNYLPDMYTVNTTMGASLDIRF
ncbi:MAG: hypothetical protein KU37_04565 [Sulfuricurvum sp. PC08-66]|nr:MAG: hypothetical protein KU37_04565 [Sulfuricurvum sp. PC08-66]